MGRRCRPPEAKRADGPEEEEAEHPAELIAVADGLNEQQSKLLENALAARREAESGSQYSTDSEESDAESGSEGSGTEGSPDEERGTEKQGSEEATKEEESSFKRETEYTTHSDDGHQQPQSSSSNSSTHLSVLLGKPFICFVFVLHADSASAWNSLSRSYRWLSFRDV